MNRGYGHVLTLQKVAVMGQTTGFDLHLFRERIEIDSSSEKFYVHYKDCTTRYFKVILHSDRDLESCMLILSRLLRSFPALGLPR